MAQRGAPNVSAACQVLLDQFCSESCGNTTVARFGASFRGRARDWRCYSPKALTADLTAYSGGKDFCTKPDELSEMVDLCRAAEAMAERGQTRPQAATPMHYALLIRGQPFRYGCNSPGVHIQLDALRSHREHIVEPLAASGHRVSAILAMDTRSYGCWGTQISALSRTLEPNVLLRNVTGVDQPTNMQKALKLVLDSRPDGTWQLARPFDSVLISRFDLKFTIPILGWLSDNPTKVAIASRCELPQWKWYNCTADLFFSVPRHWASAFASAVGYYRRDCSRGGVSCDITRCCFSSHCYQKSGHGCYNVLGGMIGFDNLQFSWPPPGPHLKINTPSPFFQCCSHGHASRRWLDSLHHNLLPS